MSMKAVLWRPMYDPGGHDLLRAAGIEPVVVDSPDAEQVKAALGNANALWVRTPERVTAEIMDAAPGLTVISTSGFGTDNIDIPAATARGILVVNHLGFGRTPVAEHTVMLLLACLKQLTWGDRAARDGTAWSQRQGLQVYELEGRTVGIVGLGYIGSELAKKLRLAFNCRVLAYDPYVNARLALVTGVEMCTDLHAMLAQCDALAMAAELTDETRNMIGAAELAALPEGAVVVNAARGQLIDLNALDAALAAGHIRAAGLDVVFPEPLPADHALLKNPKVIFTPHTAGVTQEASKALAISAAQQITTALQGEMPPFPLNPEVWDSPQSRRPR
ncbi:NAD(P)-dependent oxidoreductase [Thalassospiraceae bacterium LMO-SO8]|nr:NAD(P)-binding domain-containing protein [Alphaproteobacteria bacterium LMO-S08]WND76756.1 NAD(P)-dependent oxidoreductase [Thalassospiraceae bacterium LMO-SO8]